MRLSKRQREIIKTIGKVVLLTTAIAAPGMSVILKSLNDSSAKSKYLTKQRINKLEIAGVIYLSGEKIRLTKKGRELAKKILVEDIRIKHGDNWDGIWQLVSYDIPETRKKERDYFRKVISDLGFKQIQDSLWVFPWQCTEEIAIICQNLGIAPFVAYLNTKHLPRQSYLEKYFNL
jgi:DNA-binding transcriptional regulator PaaX